MATFKNGRQLGKLGNTTTYLLNGVLTTRRIGKSSKPASIAQKRVRMRTKVLSKFFNALKEFIQVGYELEGHRLQQVPQNPAFSQNWKHGLTGDFPRLIIDFEKILLTYGAMAVPQNPTVQAVDNGLNFSWDLQEGVPGTHWSDQVMLLAYFPKLNKAAYTTAGASRYKEIDFLPIFDVDHGAVAETYMAFISNDRKSISNSVYVGRVTW